MSAVQLGHDRWAVPGNRWDLLDDVPAPAPAVSVVIPYFDNQHDLDLVLAALAAQTHPGHLLQTIVVDDGSPEPPTVTGSGLDVTLLRQDDLGFRAGAARNLGVTRAEGEVLLFLDGDTVPAPGYVAALARLPGLLPDAVVGGRRLHADLSDVLPEALPGLWTSDRPVTGEPGWLRDEYTRTAGLLRVDARSWKYLIGAVLGCSRSLFTELGGFDESIVGYGGEDYDLTYRAFNAGAVLAHQPGAVAWHDGPDWAVRTDPDRHTPLKNRELLMLAARIPEPGTRGAGQFYPVPDVVVVLDPSGWPLGAATWCLRSLLTSVDCGIWLAAAGELSAGFAGDPRVRVGPVPADTAARARAVLTLHRPVSAAGRWRDTVADLIGRDVGTAVVRGGPADPGPADDGAGTGSGGPGPADVVAELRTTRSIRRARRWADAAPTEHWFGVETLTAADAGLTPVTADLPLAGIFGGWVPAP